ncbi:MAG: DNA methyltransferase [Candidatus Cloacimonetes bacterium]|nr:DNA methyltransferase [Candidatus Cloacimonadota bacterium]
MNHIQYKNFLDELFPAHLRVMPQTTDVFEIDLAWNEYINLKTEQEIIKRSAYIQSVNGKTTNHYKICNSRDMSEYKGKSIFTRSFFEANKYSSNYGTHGFFPYRGKFHPQMIKALINIMGLTTDDILLDPMCGSGTACIEASMIGLNSIGVDISPFCVMMSKVKSNSLGSDLQLSWDESYVSLMVDYYETIFPKDSSIDRFVQMPFSKIISRSSESHVYDVQTFLQLVYLDAMGYARRRKNKCTKDVFGEVLEKYCVTHNKWIITRDELSLSLGQSNFHVSDIQDLPLNDDSVDGIITSPPYSFAIDYADNDKPQLDYLGIDTGELKSRMIGLRGETKKEIINNYLLDMEHAIYEMRRVLKKGHFCTIIIGSNAIQTGGIRLEEMLRIYASQCNLTLIMEMIKPIKGIQNTMKEEYIQIYQKS